jgi:hypothetical protein
MPLKFGSSDETVSSNIRELHKANEKKPASKKRSRKQILAIALSKSGKPYKQPRQSL